MLGYGPGTARGRHGFDYIHPDDRDWVIDAFQRILADRSLEVSGEFRIRDAYGTWQWVEAVARNRQDDPALGGIVLSTRNITPRVDAEEAARRSEERFRALLAYASDLVIVLDASGAFVYVSPASNHLFGYSPFGDACISRPPSQSRCASPRSHNDELVERPQRRGCRHQPS